MDIFCNECGRYVGLIFVKLIMEWQTIEAYCDECVMKKLKEHNINTETRKKSKIE